MTTFSINILYAILLYYYYGVDGVLISVILEKEISLGRERNCFVWQKKLEW